MNYQEVKKVVKQYGIDFFDEDGIEVGDIVVGEDKAERDALYDEILADNDHELWPDTAVRIRQWARDVEEIAFVRTVHTPYGPRNPATGRFMRSSYRENF